MNEEFILDLLNNYLAEYKELWSSRMFALAQEMTSQRKWVGLMQQETCVLYMMVRHCKPKIVVECSPGHGWSSTWILHALRRNRDGVYYGFGVRKEELDNAIELATKFEFRDIATFVYGDVTPALSCADGMLDNKETPRNTMLPLLEDYIKEVDFFFWDGYHNYEFGKWWTTEPVKYLVKGGVIAVHDIADLYNDKVIPGNDEIIAVRELYETGKYELLQPNSITRNARIHAILNPLFNNPACGLIFLRKK